MKRPLSPARLSPEEIAAAALDYLRSDPAIFARFLAFKRLDQDALDEARAARVAIGYVVSSQWHLDGLQARAGIGREAAMDAYTGWGLGRAG